DEAALGHARHEGAERRRHFVLECSDQLPDVVDSLENREAVLTITRSGEREAKTLNEVGEEGAVARGQVVEVQGQLRRDVAVREDNQLAVPAERHADTRQRPTRKRAILAWLWYENLRVSRGRQAGGDEHRRNDQRAHGARHPGVGHSILLLE